MGGHNDDFDACLKLADFAEKTPTKIIIIIIIIIIIPITVCHERYYKASVAILLSY